MTSKRNLGPVIALTGAGITVAAVVAGFIVVGGPGDARERRLDSIAMTRISQTLNVVQCAFNATGDVPATLEDAAKTRSILPDKSVAPPLCGENQPSPDRVATGSQPAAPGDVTYRPTGGAGIRLCGNFRRAHDVNDRLDGYYPPNSAYPQLDEARPAGIHCFEFELIGGQHLGGSVLTQPVFDLVP
jgi:hypothetical protein